MRLAIDATPILAGGKGLAIFLESFLDSLSCLNTLKPTVVYVDESFFNEAKRKWPLMMLKPVCSRPAFLWERIFLPRYLRKDRVDIVFTGRDRTVCEPLSKTIVYLFEVPDYRVEATLNGKDGWYSKAAAVLTRYSFTRVVRDITHFIVSSDSTRSDLEARYDVPAGKITVVYPGLRPDFYRFPLMDSREKARQFFTKGNPYILHFVTGDPRDNTRTALAAFSQALPGLSGDMKLLLAGIRRETKTVIERDVKRYSLADQVRYAGFLSGEDLVLAYRGAEAYLDPTLYEGFGFQLLEAMTCGVPVLSSRVTSVPEIVQDAGLLFDPHDVEGFALGLVKVINESDQRDLMISKGLELARQFSWDKTVRQLVCTLEAIMGQDGK